MVSTLRDKHTPLRYTLQQDFPALDKDPTRKVTTTTKTTTTIGSPITKGANPTLSTSLASRQGPLAMQRFLAFKTAQQLPENRGNNENTSLFTEDLRDNKANCLDKAAKYLEDLKASDPAAFKKAELVFLKDGRAGKEGESGHVVVRQGNEIFDPSTNTRYPDMAAYTEKNPQYSEVGSISAKNAHDIFQAPAGSDARRTALAAAHVPQAIQDMMVADPQDPQLRGQVDLILGPDATAEQRDKAYQIASDEVEKVGGISDQGIILERVPGFVAKPLKDAGIPLVADPRVISGVDQELGETATAEQRKAAYEKVQKYVDDVGGISDQGITEEALPGKIHEILVNDNVPLGTGARRIDLEKVKSGEIKPTGAELAAHVNELRKLQGQPELTKDQAGEFDKLSEQERRFFAATLYELDRVVIDKDPRAQRDYMTNVMQHAADIAGKDGKLFTQFVHDAFSDSDGGSDPKSSGYWGDKRRQAAGGGPSPAGQFLEGIYRRTNPSPDAFNPLIHDVNPESTMTHHFGEFLAVGANRPKSFGDGVVTMVDKPEDNPGDVRNGYFGVMIGDAVESGKITPQQAVDLTKWAYSADPNGTNPPPWGSTADDAAADNKNWENKVIPGKVPVTVREYKGYLNSNRYNIDDWVAAYNKAHS